MSDPQPFKHSQGRTIRDEIETTDRFAHLTQTINAALNRLLPLVNISDS